MIEVAEPSIQSVFIVAMGTSASRGPIDLGTGSGFVAGFQGQNYLITNYHVATGRNPIDGQATHPSDLVVDSMKLVLPRPLRVDRIEWDVADLPVLREDTDEERAVWLQHPTLGRRVDVVALPLGTVSGIGSFDLHPYDLDSPQRFMARPALPVNIVGYPYGSTAGGAFPIWTQGAVASEPQLGHNDLPRFLVDARTSPGQSGSPVIFFAPNVNASGGSNMVELLGVYSGRVNVDESPLELAVVWRAEVIREILAGQVVGIPGVKLRA